MKDIVFKTTICDKLKFFRYTFLNIFLFLIVFAPTYIIVQSKFSYVMTKEGVLLWSMVFIFILVMEFLLYLMYKDVIKFKNFIKSEIIIDDEGFAMNFFNNKTKTLLLNNFKLSDTKTISVFKYYKTYISDNGIKRTSESGVMITIKTEYGDCSFDNNSSLLGVGQLKKFIKHMEGEYPKIKVDKSFFWAKEI